MVPNRVKIHTWSVFYNALPVAYNLKRRRCDTHLSRYGVCGFIEESVEHVFIGYWWAQALWRSLNVPGEPVVMFAGVDVVHHVRMRNERWWSGCGSYGGTGTEFSIKGKDGQLIVSGLKCIHTWRCLQRGVWCAIRCLMISPTSVRRGAQSYCCGSDCSSVLLCVCSWSRIGWSCCGLSGCLSVAVVPCSFVLCVLTSLYSKSGIWSDQPPY